MFESLLYIRHFDNLSKAFFAPTFSPFNRRKSIAISVLPLFSILFFPDPQGTCFVNYFFPCLLSISSFLLAPSLLGQKREGYSQAHPHKKSVSFFRKSQTYPSSGPNNTKSMKGRRFGATIRITNCIWWSWTPFLSPSWAAGIASKLVASRLKL